MPGLPRRARFVSWLLIAATFGLLTAWSWLKWPDVVVDFGHELYIPWRLAEGEVLYRDIVFPLGPASQYFVAAAFKLFGPSLLTAAILNLVLLAVFVALVHDLFWRLGDPVVATIAVLFFLIVFGFSQYTLIGNYNYVCPYRHEVTHGLTLCVLEVWCLARAVDSERLAWWIGAGVSLGLTLLVKVEFAVGALGLATWGLAIMGRWRGNTARHAAAMIVPTIVVVTVAWGLLSTQMSPGQAARALITNWELAFNPELTARSGFYRSLAGLEDPLPALGEMAVALIMLAVLAFLAVGVERALRSVEPRRSLAWCVGGLVFLLCLVPLLAGFSLDWHKLPRAFLATTLAFVAISTVQAWRSEGHDRRRWFTLGLWSILAALLMSKTLLIPGWGHYGFALTMPAALLVVYAAVSLLPEWLRHRGGGGDGRICRAVVIGLVAACAASLWWECARAYAAKTLQIGEGGDRYFVEPLYDARALPIRRVLEFLRNDMQPDETLLVIPDGTMLNFQLRRRNPTGHVLLSPWESAAFGDAAILAAVRENPPNVIVLFPSRAPGDMADMSVHGRGNLGSPQYGAELSRWIVREYRVVSTFEHTDKRGHGFQAVVFRRGAKHGTIRPGP